MSQNYQKLKNIDYVDFWKDSIHNTRKKECTELFILVTFL